MQLCASGRLMVSSVTAPRRSTRSFSEAMAPG
jgi:hypothetical protein